MRGCEGGVSGCEGCEGCEGGVREMCERYKGVLHVLH